MACPSRPHALAGSAPKVTLRANTPHTATFHTISPSNVLHHRPSIVSGEALQNGGGHRHRHLAVRNDGLQSIRPDAANGCEATASYRYGTYSDSERRGAH